MKSFLGHIDKRKFKMFLFFLGCSSLAWTISQLSETYESRARFPLKIQNIPDSLLVNQETTTSLNAKLRTSGFQFLRYGIWSKTLTVDAKEVQEGNDLFYLTDEQLKPQLENQFPNSVSILELDKKQYVLNLYRVMVKNIPVKPNIELKLAPNHILKGRIKINPPSVTIKGPESELKAVQNIQTEALLLENVTTNFSKTLKLLVPDSFVKSELVQPYAKVSGVVENFSEKEFEVEITPYQIPEGYSVRVFPSTVTLICKANTDKLKEMSSNDFEVVANIGTMEPGSNKLQLAVKQFPEDVYSVRLLQDTVEFVLEKL